MENRKRCTNRGLTCNCWGGGGVTVLNRHREEEGGTPALVMVPSDLPFPNEQTNKLKIFPSGRTSYVGGNNFWKTIGLFLGLFFGFLKIIAHQSWLGEGRGAEEGGGTLALVTVPPPSEGTWDKRPLPPSLLHRKGPGARDSLPRKGPGTNDPPPPHEQANKLKIVVLHTRAVIIIFGRQYVSFWVCFLTCIDICPGFQSQRSFDHFPFSVIKLSQSQN